MTAHALIASCSRLNMFVFKSTLLLLQKIAAKTHKSQV